MKIASIVVLLMLCVFVDAIVDFVPNDPPSSPEKKETKTKTTKKDSEDVVENDDKETHPDGQTTTAEKPDIEGLQPLKKPKSNDETKPKDKVENDSDVNADKPSQSEARMDHAEDITQENAFGEVDPEMGKDYGEEEDNSYDSVHGMLHTDQEPIEDEANSITDIDLNHDDVNINHDDVGTGK